jgi:phage anti-repressor protein
MKVVITNRGKMNTQELIPIEHGKNGLEVSSRLLHEKLGIQSHHRDWINLRIKEYNFVENRDFYFRSDLSENKRVQYQGCTAKEYN